MPTLQNVLKKMGFARAGYFKHNLYYNSKFIHPVIYSLICAKKSPFVLFVS